MAEEMLNNNLDQTNEGENSGDNNNGNSQETNNGNNGSGDSGNLGNQRNEQNNEKTFTQKQVNAMMSKEKKQGKEAAYREMGIDPKDTKMVSMFKAFINSQKSDEDKANEEKAENDAKIAEAERRAFVAEAKAEAMLLGVNKDYVDDVITLVMNKVANDESLEVKDAVEELKKKYPVWFGDSSNGNDTNKKGQKGTGSSVKGGSQGSGNNNEDNGIGKRLAAKRRGSNKQTSFWS